MPIPGLGTMGPCPIMLPPPMLGGTIGICGAMGLLGGILLL